MLDRETTISETTNRNQKPVALVIDDNDLVRTSESLLLRHAGFEVLTAKDGARGIEVFRCHRPHVGLVITDHSMPQSNGEEVCRTIHEESPETPVILVSGEADRLPDTARVDFAAVIPKPFEARQFLDTARECAGH